MSYSVEVRMATNVTDLPHTFLVITGPDGVSHAWGFAPQVTGLWGPGAVTSNDGHVWQTSTGQLEITKEQYDKLTKSEPDYSTLFSSIAAFPMLKETPD